MGEAHCRASDSWLVLLLGVLLTFLFGCGGNQPRPVAGQVLFKDGTPMTQGIVVFEPVNATDHHSARGYVKRDGSYRLGTHSDDDGAYEGDYRVQVNPPPPLPSEEGRPRKAVIHPRFESFDTSKLKYTVRRGRNEFNIVVERP